MSDIITIENLEATFRVYAGTDKLRQFFGRCMVTIANENAWASGDSDGAITANYYRKHKKTEDWQIKKWTNPTFVDATNQKRMRICRYVDVLNKAALAKANASNPDQITGKNFVLTGTLTGGTRATASDLIVRAGGNVQSAVSKKTDYVVTNDQLALSAASSHHSALTDKLKDAQNFGAEIVGETKFAKMMKDAGYHWNHR